MTEITKCPVTETSGFKKGDTVRHLALPGEGTVLADTTPGQHSCVQVEFKGAVFTAPVSVYAAALRKVASKN